MRTRSCIERITVSTFQTLYQEGLLSSGKTTLASLINIKNACMNAWRLWIVDCLNVCMYECMKTLNCWLLECMHVWMNENFKFLIVWMYACMYEWICVLDCVKILIDFSLSFYFINQMLFSNHWIYWVRKIFFLNNLWQILSLASEFKTLLTPPSIIFLPHVYLNWWLNNKIGNKILRSTEESLNDITSNCKRQCPSFLVLKYERLGSKGWFTLLG